METFINIEQFLIQSEKRAFVMARFATGDEQAALDIVQDAMIKLVKSYSNKQSQEWPPLFYRILQNLINDWHRRQKTRKRWQGWIGISSDSDSSVSEFENSTIENYASEEGRIPEMLAGDFEFSKSLTTAVSTLPARQQQAFMLRAMEECSTRETSNIMQCSEGSVKTHYSRALASLRKSLKAFK